MSRAIHAIRWQETVKAADGLAITHLYVARARKRPGLPEHPGAVDCAGTLRELSSAERIQFNLR